MNSRILNIRILNVGILCFCVSVWCGAATGSSCFLFYLKCDVYPSL